MVPGFLDTEWTPWWGWLEGYLRGMDEEAEVHSLDFSYKVSFLDSEFSLLGTAVGSIEEYAEELKEYVEDIETDKVDIIAHSMGGLVSRWYIEELEGEKNVENLVTLGTPHQGTYTAYVACFTPGASEMVPGSSLLEKLNEDDLAEDVNYTAVWNRYDEAIIPSENAKIPEKFAKGWESRINLESGTLHLGYFSRDCFEEYQESLL